MGNQRNQGKFLEIRKKSEKSKKSKKLIAKLEIPYTI